MCVNVGRLSVPPVALACTHAHTRGVGRLSKGFMTVSKGLKRGRRDGQQRGACAVKTRKIRTTRTKSEQGSGRVQMPAAAWLSGAVAQCAATHDALVQQQQLAARWFEFQALPQYACCGVVTVEAAVVVKWLLCATAKRNQFNTTAAFTTATPQHVPTLALRAPAPARWSATRWYHRHWFED